MTIPRSHRLDFFKRSVRPWYSHWLTFRIENVFEKKMKKTRSHRSWYGHWWTRSKTWLKKMTRSGRQWYGHWRINLPCASRCGSLSTPRLASVQVCSQLNMLAYDWSQLIASTQKQLERVVCQDSWPWKPKITSGFLEGPIPLGICVEIEIVNIPKEFLVLRGHKSGVTSIQTHFQVPKEN